MRPDPTREQDDEDLLSMRMIEAGASFREVAAICPSRTRDGWIGLHNRIRKDLERSEEPNE